MTKFFDAAEVVGLSGTWLGTSPLVYIRDPDLVHQVFIQNAESVTRVGPEGSGPFGILQRTVGDIVVTADGHEWRRWRRGLMNDFSNSASLKESYRGIFNIAQRHVGRMCHEEAGSDLRKIMGDYALDTLWYVAIGIDNISDDSDEFLGPLPRFLDIVGNSSHVVWHGLRNFVLGKPFQEPDKFEKTLGGDIEDVLANLLDQHLPDPTNTKFGDTRYNFLQKVSQQSGGTSADPITRDVRSQARQVYAFGHEASELLLFWAVYELSQHPAVVQKLRQELLATADSAWDLDYDKIRGMPYLDVIVTELLRLHPPVSTTARMVTKPIVIQPRSSQAVILPKGTQVLSSIHMLHHDEQVWGPDANGFVPERWFSQRRNELENRCQFLPFLSGPRGCPSSGFVLLQVKVMLAVLFFNSDIELPDCAGLKANVGAIVEPTNGVSYRMTSK